MSPVFILFVNLSKVCQQLSWCHDVLLRVTGLFDKHVLLIWALASFWICRPGRWVCHHPELDGVCACMCDWNKGHVSPFYPWQWGARSVYGQSQTQQSDDSKPRLPLSSESALEALTLLRVLPCMHELSQWYPLNGRGATATHRSRGWGGREAPEPETRRSSVRRVNREKEGRTGKGRFFLLASLPVASLQPDPLRSWLFLFIFLFGLFLLDSSLPFVSLYSPFKNC